MGLLGRSRRCAFGTAGAIGEIAAVSAIETVAAVAVALVGTEAVARGFGAGNSGKPRVAAECRAQDRRRPVREVH